jgi:alpha-glucuronidase
MPTFKADYNNGDGNIVLTDSNRTIASIRINSLLLNNGNNADNANNFEKHQQQVNYLDSVKDGANVWMLQGLEIYPRAAEGGYPTFPDSLKNFEDAIGKNRS